MKEGDARLGSRAQVGAMARGKGRMMSWRQAARKYRCLTPVDRNLVARDYLSSIQQRDGWVGGKKA